MFRALAIATGLGLATLAAAPASADVTIICISLDTRCEVFVCDSGYLIRDGYSDTGPWIVVCNPL